MRIICVTRCARPKDDTGSLDASLLDMGGPGPHSDPQMIGDEALSRRSSRRHIPGVNPGYSKGNASRQ